VARTCVGCARILFLRWLMGEISIFLNSNLADKSERDRESNLFRKNSLFGENNYFCLSMFSFWYDFRSFCTFDLVDVSSTPIFSAVLVLLERLRDAEKLRFLDGRTWYVDVGENIYFF